MTRPRTLLAATVSALALMATAACGKTTDAATGGHLLNFADLKTTTAAGTGNAGTIRWNLPYEPLSLDPIKTFNYAENTVMANACDSLLRAQPNFGFGPGLASSWSNPNPTTWIYQLRKGVKFWDGHPMTSEDVAWSIARSLDPKSGTYIGKYFVNIKSVTPTGPSAITIKLKQPDALLNQALASLAGIVIEKADALKAGSNLGTPKGLPMCTGPFELKNWAAGQSITMVRNPHYWDAALEPKSSALTFSFIADESNAVLSLSSGQLDGEFFYLPPAGLDKLEKSSKGKVTMGNSQIYWALLGAAKSGPYADPRIRQALSLVIDRKAIAAAVFQGAAIPAKTLAPPASWTYSKSIFQAAYNAIPEPSVNLDEARKLVKEAGSPTKPITIAVQGSSAVHEQTGNLIQAEAQAIGLKVNIKVVPVEQYGNIYVDPNARKGIDAFLSTYYGVPDPLDAYTMFKSGDDANYSGYSAVDGLLAAARADTDPTTRAKTVVELQKKITEDLPWTPLEELPVILFQSNRLTGATASSNYLYYPWAAAIGTK